MYERPPRFHSRGRGRKHPSQQPAQRSFHYDRQTTPIPNFDLRNPISTSTVDEAVNIARRNIIGAGENVSTWKVLLSLFEADSWRSIKVPSLYRLKLMEDKINAYINCFVEAWKITTLYDLEIEICKDLGIQKFEELELGPLIRHPLIVRYFFVSSDSTRVFKISGQEILNYLGEYLDTYNCKEVKVDELLDFIAKGRSVDSKNKLHVRIKNLGLYIGRILEAKSLENAKYKKWLLEAGKKRWKPPILMSQKNTEHTFMKLFSEDVDNEDETSLTSQRKSLSQVMQSCDQMNEGMSLVRLNCNEGVNISIKKRKSDAIDCTFFAHNKFPKSDGVGKNSKGKEIKNTFNHEFIADVSINNDSMMAFVTLWKDKCKKTVPKAMKQMLKFYQSDNPVIVNDAAQLLYKSYPLVGLINVAIRSIKYGMWDSRHDFEQQEKTITTSDSLCAVTVETEQALTSSSQKYFVTDETHNKSSLNAYMSHQLLDLLVAQASHNLSETENLSIQNVLELLTRQFPIIPFQFDIKGSLNALEDVVKTNKSNPVSRSVLFSAALLPPRIANSFSETHFSSKDAIEVLVRAPMLADLNIWSHWDVLFAPSLGPLTPWLLNDTNVKDLLCLITKSGNVIRIDHTATVDSFLKASILGSAFQTAVSLLSLFALYGGEKNVPSSLLKCHAEKAFNVKSQLSNGISTSSVFILDCLTYVPVEFRSFAIDVMLSGFRPVVKDAPSAILSECRNSEQRLMIHELGLSLGIMEWINDSATFSFSESKNSYEFDQVTLSRYSCEERKEILVQREERKVVGRMDLTQHSSTGNNEEESAKIIESIRREEFGLDSDLSAKDDSIMKKQHARLGRALHCLSQELYSQDSHFLLELVQNADDNVYPCDVEPTLTFILQEAGIVVLNNEQGFSAENIKAVCDVGNSTKKEPNAGYIGKKGIGFKSVFRVTNAPEIHSNGFHLKFDISDGQIGFVLPTVVPPCDIDLFSKLVSVDNDTTNEKRWNTCIVLPFKSNKSEAKSLISMFSDLHPSLLLFLHRLECIKFRNLLNDTFVVMKKEVVGDGIVNVFHGNKKITWFVKSRKLQTDHIRQEISSSEISMALMLEDLNDGNYIAKLDHQPVFAFLPLRDYGLKFIIQADFILPSSREEVDGDSPWNQWLLSEFPNLFVGAELSFCSLPCFRENPTKGISLFMNFVPQVGEVHGFFSCLPRMIISKLRTSKCLLLEGDNNEWVPPCKVLRNWTEKTRLLLPDSLIKEHLGVGYLNKHIILTDSLARALGIEECGPKILVQIMTCLYRSGSLKSMGLNWLSSWLNVLYSMMVNETQSDVISSLRQLSFIPLSDGGYASINDGAIWLHTDHDHRLESFGKLYPKLRIVNPSFLKDSSAENVTHMLYKVGVQQLSAHEVLKVHILPAISDAKVTTEGTELMSEYLSFIMFHFESPCPKCLTDKKNILSQLCNNAFVSTNHGYKRLVDVPIHFSKEFGNPIDINMLVAGTDMKWSEIDNCYLKHPFYKSSPEGTLKWRKFLQELGVTDFVQIVKVEKRIEDISHSVLKNMMLDDDCISSGTTIKDYDSRELMELLSHVSSNGDREKSKYLLMVLNTLWDNYFGDKITGFCSINGLYKPFKSSVLRILHGVRWLVSSKDDQLHFPKELFHNCETVHAVLGDMAPYAVPKVKNVKFLNDIGLKNSVTLDDAFSVLEVWRRSGKPFKASISQMSKFYTYIWNEMSISKQKIVESLHSQAFIFVPYLIGSTHEVVSGLFLSPSEVYWHDSTGSMELIKSTHSQFDGHMTLHPFSKMLCNVYPGLRYLFVNEFGVAENPPLQSYLQSLMELSSRSLPSQAAKTVFQVFRKWSDGLESGVLSCDDIDYLKKSVDEKNMRILPTIQDKWVSLHQSFGLICWCDDEQLKMEFKNLNNVDFICFGELTTQEKQMLQDKVSVLFRRLGFPSLSEVVTRKVIYDGPTDSCFKTALVSWALPYAQRYIYSIHPKKYSEFKLLGFKNLNCLQVVEVKKLFYKNVIKRFEIESNQLCECSCLLQDNILYATIESDTHSLYMELSRFLLTGIPELPLANFLHIITVMAESGSTEEQMESFITNSQKLLNLSSEESKWFITKSGIPLSDLNPFKSNAQMRQNVSKELIESNRDESAKIIESIRREEFGLDPDISAIEDSFMKKQNARLGRALQCLSQELYSQDSHFLLELVQNADDNMYSCDVEPTLSFILQESGVIVLNNEQGFSVENIKALCDVGNSTKKGTRAGYIGKKGIGFKSVFRVTDAPEIHSNGFHIKFDISEGQIGFVLPTVVPPCDVNLFSKLVSIDNDPTDEKHWNTCILIPFRSKKNDNYSVENLISMFSHLQPSLLLFLHHLECIKFKNLINDSLVVMRKEVVGNGIVNVSLGNEKMTWFVESCTLKAGHIRQDVNSTEISMALMLEDLDDGNYIPKLGHQPVFAFLPLRNYGLKFIIQADFILPSSREEVDGDSPWNRWLLSEFPDLFVNAEMPFCNLPCFRKNPAKGISVFMSFVPLGGEVQGFFSRLPRLIIAKLRTTNCLLLEGNDKEWVPPSKVLRNWTEETRSLLPDSFIKKHVGFGYLNKNTVLTDSLARALRIEECGPKILLQVMSSLCRGDSLKSLGFNWLSSFLNILYFMSVNGTQSDVISFLGKLRFIPLLDGKYASIKQGAIWLHCDEDGLEAFGKLYSKLRVVNPALFSDSPVENIENITQMLYKVGVQRLSSHEILKVHIIPGILDKKAMAENTELMAEYLSFIMFHLESLCDKCLREKEHILSQLRDNAFISTNHGYKRLVDVPIHFSKEFGNPVDMNKLVGGTAMKWFEVDISYLNHPVYKSSPEGTLKWRKFLQELGVTDFVQIVTMNTKLDSGPVVKDYDSQELINLLLHISSNGDREKCKYLLEVLDTIWDDYFNDKPFKSSVIRILCSFRWLPSSMGDQLHIPKDLFYNCETVNALLGDNAPYAIPMVNNVKFLNDIGLKCTVTIDDALSALKVWRSKKPFKASISQMSKFYTYIWNEMSMSKQKITESFQSQAFVFVPYSCDSTLEVVSGLFLSPSEVYWHDSIGSVEHTKSTHPQVDQHMTQRPFTKMLCNTYPDLHYFFVNAFGVAENPPLLSYLQSLLQLSTASLPSQAAKTVFQVFQKWSDGLESGNLSSDDVDYVKKIMEERETRILPTVKDKWVSLHQSFGLICWCDDEQLRMEFNNLNKVDFLFFGELTTEEKQIIQDRFSVLFRRLGIPSLSEVVTREVIYYDLTDSSYKTSLIMWALPYAQRYVYSIHPNEYSELKLSEFKNLNSLSIVVVENLFYTNVIKRLGIESGDRNECSCLLHDNILYATRKSDSHALFMELSRLLVSGIPDLHLANFLHMITTMVKSGFTEEKMELFIANSQKLPNLPSDESQWSLGSLFSTSDTLITTSGFNISGKIWPPIHWKTTPRIENPQKLPNLPSDWIIEETPSSTIPSALKNQLESGCYRDFSSNSFERDQLPRVPQQAITGRTGELVAFNFFSGKLREEKRVRWVNEVKESGLPYDIVVECNDNSKEYIEVKTTSNAKKDLFEITVREWQFAVEKGDLFSIARVVLSDGKLAHITTYRNPVKLCQSGDLQLAIRSSK